MKSIELLKISLSSTTLMIFLSKTAVACGVYRNPTWRDHVENAIQSKEDDFQKCYEMSAIRSAENITNTMIIDSFGNVLDFKSSSNHELPYKLTSCVKEVFKSIQYPTDLEENHVEIEYPINFAPPSDEETSGLSGNSVGFVFKSSIE